MLLATLRRLNGVKERLVDGVVELPEAVRGREKRIEEERRTVVGVGIAVGVGGGGPSLAASARLRSCSSWLLARTMSSKLFLACLDSPCLGFWFSL